MRSSSAVWTQSWSGAASTGRADPERPHGGRPTRDTSFRAPSPPMQARCPRRAGCTCCARQHKDGEPAPQPPRVVAAGPRRRHPRAEGSSRPWSKSQRAQAARPPLPPPPPPPPPPRPPAAGHHRWRRPKRGGRWRGCEPHRGAGIGDGAAAADDDDDDYAVQRREATLTDGLTARCSHRQRIAARRTRRDRRRQEAPTMRWRGARWRCMRSRPDSTPAPRRGWRCRRSRHRYR